MQTIEIRVQKYNDRNEILFPEIKELPFIHSEPFAMGILESGMHSGRTSIALLAKFQNEKGKEAVAIIEMSAGQLNMLASAAKGAATSFGETDL